MSNFFFFSLEEDSGREALIIRCVISSIIPSRRKCGDEGLGENAVAHKVKRGDGVYAVVALQPPHPTPPPEPPTPMQTVRAASAVVRRQ